MPIYEYQCSACKNEFEKLIFATDETDIICPKCDSNEVKKKMSASSFMSKGSISSCTAPTSKGFG